MSILFTNVTAVTMNPANPILHNAYVAVEGTNIASVGAQRPAGDFDRVIDCTGKVMMPGFVNTHTHIPMTLLRGYGGGHDLQSWLYDYIFPAEAKLDDRSVAAGILDQPLSEQEVLDAAAAAKDKFSGLVRACLKKM